MFDVLGDEEHGERHARVLDVEAGDDLRLAFDHVERRAVGLGNAGDEVDDEQREQPPEEVAEVAAALRLDDLAEVQRAGGHHDADQREAHRDFVRDHLRRGAHRAEERVLRVGGPAGEDDAVHARRGEREDVQQPGVDVRRP